MPQIVSYSSVARLYVKPLYDEANDNPRAHALKAPVRRFLLGCILGSTALVEKGQIASFDDEVEISHKEFKRLVVPKGKEDFFRLSDIHLWREALNAQEIEIPGTGQTKLFSKFHVGRIERQDAPISWKFTASGSAYCEAVSSVVRHAPSCLMVKQRLLMYLAEFFHNCFLYSPTIPDDLTYHIVAKVEEFTSLLGYDIVSGTQRFNFIRDFNTAVADLERMGLFAVIQPKDIGPHVRSLSEVELVVSLSRSDKQHPSSRAYHIPDELARLAARRRHWNNLGSAQPALGLPSQSEPPMTVLHLETGAHPETTADAECLQDGTLTPEQSGAESEPRGLEVAHKRYPIAKPAAQAAQAQADIQGSEQLQMLAREPEIAETELADHDTAAFYRETLHITATLASLLENVRETDNLVRDHDERISRRLDRAAAAEWAGVLQNELMKLRCYKLQIPVFGTTKAGKSTSINALAGMGVMPSRNTPMTICPVVIEDVADRNDPTLRLRSEALKKASADIRAKLERTPLSAERAHELESLLDRLSAGEFDQWEELTTGVEEIALTLERLNGLYRLALSEQIGVAVTIEELPTIEGTFLSYDNSESEPRHDWTISLIDTGGVNEFSYDRVLEGILQNYLQKASAAILVCDYTQPKVLAEQQILAIVGRVPAQLVSRVFVLMNKFDQKTSADADFSIMQQHLVQALQSKISGDRIFPVSAKQANLATWAKKQVDESGRLPVNSPIADEFGKEAMGVMWSSLAVQQRETWTPQAISTLWTHSGFHKALSGILQFARDNAQLLAAQSASAKVKEYGGMLLDFLRARGTLIEQDKELLQGRIQELERDIREVNGVREEVLGRLPRYRDELTQPLRQALTLEEEVKQYLSSEIAIAKQHIEMMRTKLPVLQVLWSVIDPDASGAGKDLVFDGANHQREAEEKFEAVWASLQEVILAAIERMITGVSKNIGNIKESIEKDVMARLEPYVSHAADLLMETSGVNFSPPSFRIERRDLNLDVGDTPIDQKDYEVWRAAPGIWAWVLRLFGSDDGYAIETGQRSVIKLAKLREHVRSKFAELRTQLETKVFAFEAESIEPAIEGYFGMITVPLERIKNDWADSLSAAELTVEEHTKLLNSIEEFTGEIEAVRDVASSVNLNVGILLSSATESPPLERAKK